MSGITFFILLLFIYLLVAALPIIGFYFIGNFSLVILTENCFNIFSNFLENASLPLIIKSDKSKLIINFVAWQIVGLIGLGIFIWLVTLINDGQYLLIVFVGIYFIALLISFLLLKKLVKKINKFANYNNKLITKIFLDYQLNFIPNNLAANIINFEVLKNSEIARENRAFQYQQKRYLKKIKQLNSKHLNQEKYEISFLNNYLNYLKANAYLIKGLETNQLKNNYSIMVNKEVISLEEFKQGLIYNFFSFKENDDSDE